MGQDKGVGVFGPQFLNIDLRTIGAADHPPSATILPRRLTPVWAGQQGQQEVSSEQRKGAQGQGRPQGPIWPRADQIAISFPNKLAIAPQP
jgi:hypothetical protein